MRIVPVFVVVVCLCLQPLSAEQPPSAETTRRLDTLRYGIEGQVIELLTTLATEKNDLYIEEIIAVFDRSTSPKLKTAILDFLGRMERRDAEKRCVEIIKKRDTLPDILVASAFQYLLALRSSAALLEAVEIIEADEKNYLEAAIKTVAVSGSEAEAEALHKAYEADGTEQRIKEQIVLALGAMKSAASFDLLASIVTSDEAGKVLRMYACGALGDLGDPRGIAMLVTASVSTDPNVRASAIAALGKFKTEEARAAVREGLRDGHVLARAAAAKAAGMSRDEEALPYLEYKVSYDPEKSVKEASVKALSEIGGERVEAFLLAYASEAKNNALYRSSALGALVSKGSASVRIKALELFTTVQNDKDRAVFTAFARAALAVDSETASPFALVLLGDRDFAMKLGALAWAERNKAGELLDTIRLLADSDPNEAVKKRAAQAIERLDR